MTLRLIVAISSDGVIGIGNELPWRLRDDLRHFQKITMGRTVIMGANTFDSIGRPLPGRHNMVVTSRPRGNQGNLQFVKTPPFMADADIIGGVSLYERYLAAGAPDELIITFVDACVSSRPPLPVHRFPMHLLAKYTPSEELLRGEQSHDNEYPFKIIRYIRR